MKLKKTAVTQYSVRKNTMKCNLQAELKMKTVEITQKGGVSRQSFQSLEAIDGYLHQIKRFLEELTVLMATMPLVKFALLACLNQASKAAFP